MQQAFFEQEELSGFFRDRLLAISRERLEAATKACKTYASLARRLCLVSGNLVNTDRKWLVSRLDHDGIDHSHLELAYLAENRGKVPRRLPAYAGMSDEEILKEYFVVDSPYDWTTIRTIINRRKLLPQQCRECGIGPKWNGVRLVLQYDHINGVRTDQRLENLRTICPNCHSQTDTFAGRNALKTDWKSFLEVTEPKKKFDIPTPDEG